VVGVGRVVQDRVELEILLLRKRVVFVVVALGAGHRRAHPRAHRRVHAVDDGDGAKLLVDRAPLVVGERVAVEGGGHLVVERGVRQQVAGQLTDCELVERHVGVEGPDHPVAPAPDRARRVVGIAGAVGIPGEVEPLPRHVLAVAVVREEPIDEPLDRVGRRVGHERLDLVWRRRQAGEIEGEPAGERGPVGLRLRLEAFGFEPGEDEAIDVVFRPGRLLHRRHSRPLRGHVGPVRLVRRAGRDPTLEEIDLLLRQSLARFRRRHHDVGVGRRDPPDELALVGLARHDRRVAAEIGRRPRERVEPQALVAAACPALRVGPVAAHAAVREDALDVAGERRRFAQ
jgi:hypothetical protein